LDKLYASNSAVGIASDMMLSALNTNSHVYHVSPALTIIEKQVSHDLAELFGLHGQFAGGLTFPGGSYSNIHSLVTARNILHPETKRQGSRAKDLVIFTSEHGHYSVQKAVELCGIGSDSMVSIPVDDKGCMRADLLRKAVEKSVSEGRTPFYVNATMGTTVLGSFDPFEEIAKICKEFNLWHHIDGSWGGMFCFSRKLAWKLRGAELADSITVNPHKLGGIPTTCSFLLAPDARIFHKANSLKADYLFHDLHTDNGESFDLADYTMGCGRRPDALKLWLAWVYQGRRGFEERIDHAYDMTSYFADRIDKHKDFHLVSTNPPPCCQTCFYYAPNGVLGTAANARTSAIAQALEHSGRYLVDYAPGPDGKGSMFRAVIVSPKVNKPFIDELIDAIHKVGATLKVDDFVVH